MSVIDESPSYSGPSYPSSPVLRIVIYIMQIGNKGKKCFLNLNFKNINEVSIQQLTAVPGESFIQMS